MVATFVQFVYLFIFCNKKTDRELQKLPAQKYQYYTRVLRFTAYVYLVQLVRCNYTITKNNYSDYFFKGWADSKTGFTYLNFQLPRCLQHLCYLARDIFF